METGNVRKARKTAEMICRLVDHIRKEKSLSENLARESFDQIDDLAKEALIALPRNCDVGTAEEQVGRHTTWCKARANVCLLPKASKCVPCFARWAQMPYEAEEGGAE